MEFKRPNDQGLTPEEMQDLERLKTIIEKAVADGKITRTELDNIKTAAWSDKKILFEELELYRKLVQDKINSGELEMDYGS